MKFNNWLLLFFCWLPFTSLFAGIPQKKALLVGISNYPTNSGWNKINALNDIRLLKTALLEQGFTENDILVLSEAKATKQGIITAFKKHFAYLKPGDFAYFHFSGHGQQVIDRNKDELDQLDEAIVPYDATRTPNSTYSGQNHILDDELAILFKKLRIQLQKSGQLFVTIDACHSGSVSRGKENLSIARGTTKPFGTDVLPTQQDLFFSSKDKQTNDFAPLILFSATSQDELNYEFRDNDQEYYGPLSYALAKHFPYIKENTSYTALFDDVRRTMAEIAIQQVPISEGDLNRIIWSGKLKGKTNYYQVTKQRGKDYFQVDGGLLTKLLPGSTVAFHPPETRDTKNSQVIAHGVVIESEAFFSWIKTTRLPTIDLANKWIIIEEQNFGELQLNLKLDLENQSLLQPLKSAIFTSPHFVLNPIHPDIVIQEKRGNISVFSTTDQTIFQKKVNNSTAKTVIGEIINNALFPYLQAAYLRRLPLKNKEFEVTIELVPVLVEDNPYDDVLEIKETLSINTKKNSQGNIVFQEMDHFQIKVHNKGTEKAFFAILAIQSDNKINVLVPSEDYQPSEYFIAPNKTKILNDIWQIAPPFGQEVFKVIASDQPMNWRTLDHLRGNTNNDFFGIPTLKMMADGERGTVMIRGNPSAANVNTFIFRIEKK